MFALGHLGLFHLGLSASKDWAGKKHQELHLVAVPPSSRPKEGMSLPAHFKGQQEQTELIATGSLRERLESNSVYQILGLETFSDKSHFCIFICTYRSP